MIFSNLGSHIGAVNYGIVDGRVVDVDMLTDRIVEKQTYRLVELQHGRQFHV